MCLDYRRKPEYQEKTYTGTGRTCKLYRQRLQPACGLDTKTFLLWGDGDNCCTSVVLCRATHKHEIQLVKLKKKVCVLFFKKKKNPKTWAIFMLFCSTTAFKIGVDMHRLWDAKINFECIIVFTEYGWPILFCYKICMRGVKKLQNFLFLQRHLFYMITIYFWSENFHLF